MSRLGKMPPLPRPWDFGAAAAYLSPLTTPAEAGIQSEAERDEEENKTGKNKVGINRGRGVTDR